MSWNFQQEVVIREEQCRGQQCKSSELGVCFANCSLGNSKEIVWPEGVRELSRLGSSRFPEDLSKLHSMMQFIRGSGGHRHRGWAPINICKKYVGDAPGLSGPGYSHLTQVESHKQKGTGGRYREPMTDSQPVPIFPPWDHHVTMLPDGKACVITLLRSPEQVVAASGENRLDSESREETKCLLALRQIQASLSMP